MTHAVQRLFHSSQSSLRFAFSFLITMDCLFIIRRWLKFMHTLFAQVISASTSARVLATASMSGLNWAPNPIQE